MFDIFIERLKQKNRTITFPSKKIDLPERYRGRPVIDNHLCTPGCRECVNACPTDALIAEAAGVYFDLSRCIFCLECLTSCPRKAIQFTQDYRLAARTKSDLLLKTAQPLTAACLDKTRLKYFKRSLKLRQVSAGGCNACEADVNVLNTVVYDLARFGIQFVASPRHADGVLITGPVTKNMKLALLKTYEAIPTPKVVLAVGTCSISGGLFNGHDQVLGGADSLLPVDLYIPGCPPHPLTILDGILRLLDKT